MDINNTGIDPKNRPEVNFVHKIACDICGQFFHRYALYRHKRDIHNPVHCSCELCHTQFKSREYLQRHMRYTHGISATITSCVNTGSNNNQPTQMSVIGNQHGPSHGLASQMSVPSNGGVVVPVPVQPQMAHPSNSNGGQVPLQQNPYPVPAAPRQKKQPKRVDCDICGQSFHKYALYRHRRDMHFPKVCVCDLCNAEFKSEEYVTRHKLYKHGIGTPPYTNQPAQPVASGAPTNPMRHRSTCEFCGESFHRYALYRHKRDVHFPIICVCEICNTQFKSEEYLHRHMGYKHGIGVKNFKCEVCKSKFSTDELLRDHQCKGPPRQKLTKAQLAQQQHQQQQLQQQQQQQQQQQHHQQQQQQQYNNPMPKEYNIKPQTSSKIKGGPPVSSHPEPYTCRVCARVFGNAKECDSHEIECAAKKMATAHSVSGHDLARFWSQFPQMAMFGPPSGSNSNMWDFGGNNSGNFRPPNGQGDFNPSGGGANDQKFSHNPK